MKKKVNGLWLKCVILKQGFIGQHSWANRGNCKTGVTVRKPSIPPPPPFITKPRKLITVNGGEMTEVIGNELSQERSQFVKKKKLFTHFGQIVKLETRGRKLFIRQTSARQKSQRRVNERGGLAWCRHLSSGPPTDASH